MKTKTIFTDVDNHAVYENLEHLLITAPQYGHTGMENYWQDKGVNKLLEILSMSVFYRDMLKREPEDGTLQLLIEESPSLLKVFSEEDVKGAIANTKNKMGDFHIINLPYQTEIVVKGTHYKGINDVCLASLKPDAQVSCIMYIHPCFDSSDYETSSHTSNYFFCSRDSDTWKAISSLQFTDCYVEENLPKELLPVVFFLSSTVTMSFAYQDPDCFIL